MGFTCTNNEDFTFSEAITWLRNGYRVARKGWNGKNMCIYLTEGSEVPFSKCKKEVREAIESVNSKVIGDATLSGTEYMVKINPHIDMICADGSIACGWNASQTDMMAADWYIAD